VSHDVFISYADEDFGCAQAIYNWLGQRGIACWLARRDLEPGGNWPAQIVAAIPASRALVLILSESAANSKHVLREIDQADRKSIPIIPYQIEKAELTDALAYYLQLLHFLTAWSLPDTQALDELYRRLRLLIPTATEPPRLEPAGSEYPVAGRGLQEQVAAVERSTIVDAMVPP